MADLMTEIDMGKPAGGFISYAGDFMIDTKLAVTATCEKTVTALKPIGQKTDEANFALHQRMENITGTRRAPAQGIWEQRRRIGTRWWRTKATQQWRK